MVQVINDPTRGHILGRIGKNFGAGLAEQIPKEVERGRLASGLEALSKEEGLTPFQQLGKLATLPGVTPQLIQSGAELLRQQGVSQGLKKAGDQSTLPKSNPFKGIESQKNTRPESKSGLQPTPSGLVSSENTQAALDTYIPKTLDQINARANELYGKNPELYPNPESAIKAAQLEDQQNQSISTAKQNARSSQIGVEDRARSQLSELRKSAGVEIPDNIYQQVENDVLDKIRAGKGETESTKDGQKELDTISRDYKALKTTGTWKLLTKRPAANKAELRSIRQKFKERNDLENLADSYTSENGLTPSKAYYLAYPVSENKELNNEVMRLPDITPKVTTRSGALSREVLSQEDLTLKTLGVALKIAPKMGKEASPLAIATELQARGYDPKVWMDYVDKNRRKLDLSARQERELGKGRDFIPSMDDLWMFNFSGLEKLVEQ